VRAGVLAGLLGLAALPAAQEPALLALRSGALELTARWEPLTDTQYGLEQRHAALRAPVPAAARQRHDVERFRPFLPPGPVAVGDTWRVDARAALPFLRQLCAGATDVLHHTGVAAPGAWACLRALDATRAEIVLRVHAELRFDGEDGRTLLWLTPAQFRGRLLLDRARGEVLAFELAVPDGSANADVNLRQEGGVVADIGRIPVLALAAGELPPADGAGGLSLRAAEELLARRFYPLAELEWLALDAALARARASGKPLHVVTLFGSLLDEAC